MRGMAPYFPVDRELVARLPGGTQWDAVIELTRWVYPQFEREPLSCLVGWELQHHTNLETRRFRGDRPLFQHVGCALESGVTRRECSLLASQGVCQFAHPTSGRAWIFVLAVHRVDDAVDERAQRVVGLNQFCSAPRGLRHRDAASGNRERLCQGLKSVLVRFMA